MVSITATSLDDLLAHDTSITDAQLEAIIDMAIHCLNMYGADLPNMSGASGSKTVSLESKQAGAVLVTAREIYYGFYKPRESVSLAGMSITQTNVMSNPAFNQAIRQRARQLTEIEVDIG